MTDSRKRSNIVPLSADPRAENALKYRPAYCVRVKEMAKRGCFPEQWAAELGVSMDFVAQTRLGTCFPLPRTDLAYGHGMRYAKSCEAV